MDGLLPRGCVLWGSPASGTVPNPQSRLYMAGKAKTSFPILLTKLMNWVCTTFLSCPSLAVTLVSILESDATFDF